MKKRLKGLMALLLAMAMIVTGQPVETRAEEEDTPSVEVYSYVGSSALSSGQYIREGYSDWKSGMEEHGSKGYNIEITPNITMPDYSITGWNVWSVKNGNSSGDLLVGTKSTKVTLKADGAISEDVYNTLSDEEILGRLLLEAILNKAPEITNAIVTDEDNGEYINPKKAKLTVTAEDEDNDIEYYYVIYDTTQKDYEAEDIIDGGHGNSTNVISLSDLGLDYNKTYYYAVAVTDKAENITVATGSSFTFTTEKKPVAHTPKPATITYANPTYYDVTQLFTLDTNAGTPTYTLVEGTSGGTGDGTLGTDNKLTINKCGTFIINVTTEANGDYAAGSAQATLTVNKAENAPGMPATTLEVPYEVDTVSKYTSLPNGWKWADDDKDKSLEVGSGKTAKAVYIGADAANYVNTSVEITITRLECGHEDAENDGNHTCDVCGKDDITDHDYGDVACKEAAECTECGTNRDAALDDHEDIDKDHKCDRDCGKTDMGEHKDAEDDKDHICDYGCGAVLEDCSDVAGDNNHACDVCGKDDVTVHNYSAATCEKAATCSECKETDGDSLGHTADKWSTNKTNHWHVCSRKDCGEKYDTGAHYDTVEDDECDACGYSMPKSTPDTPETPIVPETPDTPETPTATPTPTPMPHYDALLGVSPEETALETTMNVGDVIDINFWGIENWVKEDYTYKWTSTNPSVVSINNTGVCTVLDSGDAILTLELTRKADGWKPVTAPLHVFIPEAEYDVFLGTSGDEAKILWELPVGETVDFNFYGVKNWRKNDYKCEWTSSDEKIAVVNDTGVVTTKASGLVVIHLKLTKVSTGEVLNVAPVVLNVTEKEE